MAAAGGNNVGLNIVRNEESPMVIRPRERKLDTFEMDVSYRGTTMEYGDLLCFPCKPKEPTHLKSIGHYSNCKKCGGHRLLLDSWETANNERKALNLDRVHNNLAPLDITDVPPLTFAGAQKLMMLLNPSVRCIGELLTTPAKWNPYENFKVVDEEENTYTMTSHTIVQVWNGIDETEKYSYIRPKLPTPKNFTMTIEQAPTVPRRQAALNMELEAYRYLLECAINDGRINRAYINATLVNMGIVPDHHADVNEKKNFSKSAGCNVGHVYHAITSTLPNDPPANNLPQECWPSPNSPRKRRHPGAGQPVLPNPAQIRRNLFAANQPHNGGE